MGAADAQVGPFAALRADQDAAGVCGENGGQQDAREAEEQEHPLAHGSVVLGDLERVRDVVDQVVLTGRDLPDRPRDRPPSAPAPWRDPTRSRDRSTSTSTSCTGGLLRVVPRAALAAWNAGTIAFLNVAGLTMTASGTYRKSSSLLELRL